MFHKTLNLILFALDPGGASERTPPPPTNLRFRTNASGNPATALRAASAAAAVARAVVAAEQQSRRADGDGRSAAAVPRTRRRRSANQLCRQADTFSYGKFVLAIFMFLLPLFNMCSSKQVHMGGYWLLGFISNTMHNTY